MAFRVSHFGRKTNKATLPPPENPAAIGKQNKKQTKKEAWKYCAVSLAGSHSPKSDLILPCVVITLSLSTS